MNFCKVFLLFLTFSHFFVLHGQAPTNTKAAPINIPPGSPVTVNVTTNVDARTTTKNINESNQTTQQQTTQTQINVQEIKQVITNYAQSCVNFAHLTKDMLLEQSQTFYEQYKKWFIPAGLCVVYVYVLYELTKGNQIIANHNAWAAWNDDMCLVTLAEIPEKKLYGELIVDIQKQYTDPLNPTDWVTPCIIFHEKLLEEQKILERYLRIGRWLESLKLSLIYPVNATRLEQAQEKLERLMFVRDLFFTWAANYKIDSNQLRSMLSNKRFKSRNKSEGPVTNVVNKLSMMYYHLFGYDTEHIFLESGGLKNHY